jgi:hypothetical protein
MMLLVFICLIDKVLWNRNASKRNVSIVLRCVTCPIDIEPGIAASIQLGEVKF